MFPPFVALDSSCMQQFIPLEPLCPQWSIPASTASMWTSGQASSITIAASRQAMLHRKWQRVQTLARTARGMPSFGLSLQFDHSLAHCLLPMDWAPKLRTGLPKPTLPMACTGTGLHARRQRQGCDSGLQRMQKSFRFESLTAGGGAPNRTSWMGSPGSRTTCAFPQWFPCPWVCRAALSSTKLLLGC